MSTIKQRPRDIALYLTKEPPLEGRHACASLPPNIHVYIDAQTVRSQGDARKHAVMAMDIVYPPLLEIAGAMSSLGVDGELKHLTNDEREALLGREDLGTLLGYLLYHNHDVLGQISRTRYEQIPGERPIHAIHIRATDGFDRHGLREWLAYSLELLTQHTGILWGGHQGYFALPEASPRLSDRRRTRPGIGLYQLE